MLSKLIAIGGAMEEESFEVQVKVRIADPTLVLAALKKPEIEILHYRHYHEYDTYFSFDDPNQGRLRYREDEFIDEKGEVANVRYRLTLIGQAANGFPRRRAALAQPLPGAGQPQPALLPRVLQTQPREFRRKRPPALAGAVPGMEFFINLDHVEQPDLGYFLEIKSRTWSRSDAERKAQVTNELITFLGASPTETVSQDYVEIAEKNGDAA